MIVHVLSATVAVYFFGFLFNIKGRQLFFSALGGGLAALAYEVGMILNINLMLTLFLATLCFSIYSEIMARLLKTTVTTFAISGLIPLVPGKGMYMTMLYLVNGDMDLALNSGLTTLASAGIIALGVMVVSTFYKAFNESKANELLHK